MDLWLEGEGRSAGTAVLEQLETDTLFTVQARLPPGLWRIVACSRSGELVLGVLEGGSCRLQRRFSRELTGRLGTVESVKARCSAGARMESEWRAALPGELADLPPLPAETLIRRRGNYRTVALPWREDTPFPLPALFCFARVADLAQEKSLLFTFDDSGNPVMEEN